MAEAWTAPDRHPCREAKDFAPIDRDVIGVDKPADQRSKNWRRDRTGKQIQSAIFDIPQSRGEAEAQHVASTEHVVGGAARIGVVLFDLKTALVVEQAIEDMRRFARGRGNDLGMIRAELIGDMGVERYAWLIAVAGVHIRDCLAMAASSKILPVR